MLRTGLVVVAVMLVMPGAALANGTVHRDGPTQVITYTSDGSVDDVQATVVFDTGGGQNVYAVHWLNGHTVSADNSGCHGDFDFVECTPDTVRYIFDLRAGNDTATMDPNLNTSGLPDVPSTMSGGAGNDTLGGSENQPDVLNGDAGNDGLNGFGGNDTITGGAGRDTIQGGDNDDTINARDREIDTVNCGAGVDTANLDWNDAATGCEVENRSPRDDDADGWTHAQDCNDANARIHPGATEIPNNGVDEDCSNGDLRADVDGDGALPPDDCNDANVRIHPGGADKPQNGIDEDCSGKDAPFFPPAGRISTSWSSFTAYTLVLQLAVSEIPSGGKVVVRCTGKKKGCPFAKRKLKVRKHKASATKLFKGAKLAPGAVVEIRITDKDTIGNVVRYTIRSHSLPKRRQLCLTPGTKKPGKCA